MDYSTNLEKRLLNYKEIQSLTVVLHLIVIFASLIIFIQFEVDVFFIISVIFIVNLLMRLKENHFNFYCSIANFIINERLDSEYFDLYFNGVFSKRRIKIINHYLGKIGGVQVISKL